MGAGGSGAAEREHGLEDVGDDRGLHVLEEEHRHEDEGEGVEGAPEGLVDSPGSHAMLVKHPPGARANVRQLPSPSQGLIRVD